MSTVYGNFVIALKAVDEASGVMDKLRVGLGGLSGMVSEISPALGSIASGFAAGGAFGAVVAGIGGLVVGLKDCVAQAMSAEDVWNRLKVTVENSGATWIEVRNQVEKFAQSAANMSRFSDEQVAAALKTLMDYGMSLEKAMATVNATMDLAAGKQVSLAEAATAVGKAYSGQEGILTRMGVVIEDSVPKAERFAAAMGQVAEKFGGAAQKDLDTYAGKWAQFQMKWAELMEKIGGAILPVLTTVLDVTIKIVDCLTGFFDTIKGLCEGFHKWLVGGSFIQETMLAVLKVIQELGAKIVESFGAIWEGVMKAAMDALKGLSDFIANGLKGIQDTFAALWKALVRGSIWTDMWRDMVSQTVDGMDQILSESERGISRFEGMFAGAAGRFSLTSSLSVPGPSPLSPTSVGSAGPELRTVNITIHVASMTGEVKDLDNLARRISVELANVAKWRQ